MSATPRARSSGRPRPARPDPMAGHPLGPPSSRRNLHDAVAADHDLSPGSRRGSAARAARGLTRRAGDLGCITGRAVLQGAQPDSVTVCTRPIARGSPHPPPRRWASNNCTSSNTFPHPAVRRQQCARSSPTQSRPVKHDIPSSPSAQATTTATTRTSAVDRHIVPGSTRRAAQSRSSCRAGPPDAVAASAKPERSLTAGAGANLEHGCRLNRAERVRSVVICTTLTGCFSVSPVQAIIRAVLAVKGSGVRIPSAPPTIAYANPESHHL